MYAPSGETRCCVSWGFLKKSRIGMRGAARSSAFISRSSSMSHAFLADEGKIQDLVSRNTVAQLAVLLPKLHLFANIGGIQIRPPIVVGLRRGQAFGSDVHLTRNQLQVSIILRARNEVAAIIVIQE